MATNRRCGYCKERGHTRRTCDREYDRIERLRDLHGSGYFTVARYDEKKARASTRTCSWCKSPHHTRATCDDYKTAREDVRGLIAEYRGKWVERACSTGWTLGGMVSAKDSVVEHYPKYAAMIIASVAWDQINPVTKRTAVYTLKAPAALMSKWGGLESTGHGTSCWYGFTANVPGNSAKFRAALPPGFLDGTLGLKKFFADRKKDYRFCAEYWKAFISDTNTDLYELSAD